MNWISVDVKLPEPAQRVLVIFPTGYKDTIRISLVKYIPKKTVKADDLWDENSDCTEYDEELDCYYAEEGWYEDSYESETDWRLTHIVTHWMPLPQAIVPTESPSSEATAAV